MKILKNEQVAITLGYDKFFNKKRTKNEATISGLAEADQGFKNITKQELVVWIDNEGFTCYVTVPISIANKITSIYLA